MTTTTDSRRLILVTGAAGNIGRYFAQHANKEKYNLRLMVGKSFFLLISFDFIIFRYVL
jgi:nucleoside-diphosphate-sugar epimerase